MYNHGNLDMAVIYNLYLKNSAVRWHKAVESMEVTVSIFYKTKENHEKP